MDWVWADSRAFAEMAYDDDKHQLYIRFHSGKISRFIVTSSFRAISTTSCLPQNPEARILRSRFGANSCMRKSWSRIWALV